jgi:hypothetical protein
MEGEALFEDAVVLAIEEFDQGRFSATHLARGSD